MTAVRKRRRLGIGLASRGTKIEAWMRSSGTDARDSEPSTKNSSVDRQAPHDAVVERLGHRAEQRLRPQRLDAEQAVDEDRRVGRGERGKQQRIGPDQRCRPTCRVPRRCALAPRQISPPKKAGANCAIAANDIRPIEARRALLVLSR